METEKFKDALIEAEAALWRVPPNVYTVEYEGSLGKADPFEGPGETYRAAYEREKNRADIEYEKRMDAEARLRIAVHLMEEYRILRGEG